MKGYNPKQHFFFLMLDANKANSITSLESSSIKLFAEGVVLTSSFSLKLMVKVECDASLSNQWSQD